MDLVPLSKNINYSCIGVFMACMSPIMPVLNCLTDYSFVVSFEIRKWESFHFIILFQVVLTIVGPLNFHIHFRISVSVSTKRYCVESVGSNWGMFSS